MIRGVDQKLVYTCSVVSPKYLARLLPEVCMGVIRCWNRRIFVAQMRHPVANCVIWQCQEVGHRNASVRSRRSDRYVAVGFF